MQRLLHVGFVMVGAVLWIDAPRPTLRAADAGETNARPRRTFFSSEEIATVRAEVDEANRQREIRRSQFAAEPIIVLAPFIVEGDRSLLIASIRRQLETTPESIRRRITEVAPALAYRAAYTARTSDAFFNAPSPGTPRGVSGVGKIDFVRLSRDPPESIADVFRAPP